MDGWGGSSCILSFVLSAETPEDMFHNITRSLQQSHSDAISSNVQTHPWIFVNAGKTSLSPRRFQLKLARKLSLNLDAGGWMGSFCVIYSSLSEYVLLFGTPMGSGGHSGRYWAHIGKTARAESPLRSLFSNLPVFYTEDTMLTGVFHQWPEGSIRKETHLPPATIVHQRWEATHVAWETDTWMVEYARGFIPSAMPFALADSFFSALDFISVWKSMKIYGQEVLRNLAGGRW